ncbi:hypothetical protein CHS0354_007615 [Potamilus streckersoni]|uniref:Uncharacterized protein n=1 Tax=Potamilus streckersoni TaxID=2493646 RepID=A0AAE0W7H5_9BIVA|nr:hypothetical protein CHS0354_007615 [Potamilus streckersoni]
MPAPCSIATIKKRCCSGPVITCLLTLNLIGTFMMILLLMDVRKMHNPLSSQDKLRRLYEERQFLPVFESVHSRNQIFPENGTDKDIFEEQEPEKVLDYIPPVPKISDSDVVPSLTNEIMEQYLELPDTNYTDTIVIFTPVRNSAEHLETYETQLVKLTYPHHLISVFFGEDNSDDRTFTIAKMLAKRFSTIHGFKRSKAFHFNITGGVDGVWGDIHERTMQFARRKHLAKSRNMLLRRGLKDEKWVLWIDCDISQTPKDLIQQLLFANKDLVSPCCLFRYKNFKRNYDKNIWRETDISLEDQKHMSRDQLMLEGYGPTSRIYLPDLRAEGRVVPIDGVGGCALLVRADCHRKGLIFPEDVYEHVIETEGLAKMAKKMGYSVYGMPFVEVFH